MIYCVGTTTVPNDEITISNNNIYDFFSTYTNSSGGVNTWGLYFGGTSGGSSTTANINILNNCFYETTSLVNTGDNKGGHIVMSLVPSKSVKVQGNYIGGSAPFCKGNTFTKSGNNTRFIGILTSVETATGKIYIENNKINNINWTNTGDETFVTIGASSSQSSGNYIRMRISI
ncbi:MAG: hypothetical protein BWY38_03280 [Ignavibacteria bacterium ADurb.Bin266]|nr:MAG: hypothetical protein BWY38_03280 [Ignavibacteria bacterium ADurb.Bin266]